jgi:cytochrome bd-type quinol oxidase subunit 2
MFVLVTGVMIGAGSIVLGVLGLMGKIPDRSSDRAREALPQSWFAWGLILVGVAMIIGLVFGATSGLG